MEESGAGRRFWHTAPLRPLFSARMRCVSSDFSHFVRCAAAYCAQETAMDWNATLYDTKRYFSEYGRDVPHCVPQNMPNLGCGAGTLTAPLAPLCHRVLNVDSSTMVRCAQEAHGEVEFMVCDTLALPFCGERRVLVCEFGAHGNIAAIESAFSLSERGLAAWLHQFFVANLALLPPRRRTTSSALRGTVCASPFGTGANEPPATTGSARATRALLPRRTLFCVLAFFGNENVGLVFKNVPQCTTKPLPRWRCNRSRSKSPTESRCRWRPRTPFPNQGSTKYACKILLHS